MIRVFVYGTLKKGYGNHHVLGANPSFLGEGKVMGMQVYHGPGFPYAYTGAGCVIGEVYEIGDHDARRVDQLEGYPYHYDRKEVLVDMDGWSTTAWMYFVHEKPNTELIEHGIWRGRR